MQFEPDTPELGGGGAGRLCVTILSYWPEGCEFDPGSRQLLGVQIFT